MSCNLIGTILHVSLFSPAHFYHLVQLSHGISDLRREGGGGGGGEGGNFDLCILVQIDLTSEWKSFCHFFLYSI